MKILSKQDFNQNESKNFVVDNLSSAPSNPLLGQIYYNTQEERAYICIKAGETPEWADLTFSDYGSLPIGSIIPYSGITAPEGYSICDGKELNRETYKELFSIIGTTFGSGDNSTTFNLPNLAGRTSVGLDSSDTDFDALGKTGGSKYLQKHKHTMGVHIGYDGGGSNSVQGSNGSYNWANTNPLNDFPSESGTGDSGNLQPYMVLNYIIKIYGEAMLTGDVIDSLEGDSSYNAPSVRSVNEGLGNIINEVNSKFNYSTEEVVIGTWFGKPLYRKTIQASVVTGTNSLASTVSNIDYLWIDLSKSFIKGTFRTSPLARADYRSETYSIGTVYGSDTNIIYVILGTDSSLPGTAYITMNYTKTTD